jgi:GntR family transcriptional regulator
MARTAPLSITIATGDSRPIARQIVDSIRLQISTGGLVEEDKLPSVRALAQQLAVNPNTVSKAYAHLIAEGWLSSRAGLGLFVEARREPLSDEERERRMDSAVDRYVSEVVATRYPPDAAVEKVASALAGLGLRRSA